MANIIDYKKFTKLPWSKINLNKIPLHMIQLNKIPLKRIGNLLNKLMPKKDVKHGEKILNYIRIYTRLVNAYDLLNKDSYQRAFDHLVIVKNLTREITYREENRYIENINKIVKDILKKKRSIVRRLKKYEATDPAHSKTNLLLAQNICILRIMKVSL